MSLSSYVLAAVLASATPAPGDGLSLMPSARPAMEQLAVTSPKAPALPVLPVLPAPIFPSLPFVVVAVAGVLRPPRPEDTITPPRTTVVVVPGFASPASGTFDDLAAAAGLAEASVTEFDWRWVTGDADHATASRRAGIAEAADVLESQLRELADETDRVYLVGHSKGGALLAELVARWDSDPDRVVAGVVGAMLLDPPLATGPLGDLQRLGRRYGLPNNGGYDPIDCGWLSCRDTRHHLGRSSGIDVVVVRNPDALVTSFVDVPAGVRVYDLDDGGGSAVGRVWEEGGVLERVAQAHSAPLRHPAVAACLADEIAATGSCRWEAGAVHGPARRPTFAGGGGGSARF